MLGIVPTKVLTANRYKFMKKFYDKYSWLIIILLLVIIGLKFCSPSTSRKETTVPISLKNETRIKDSFRTVIKYHDSTRVKTVIKHRELIKTILKDSTACFTEVLYVSESCEDVMAKDSILISSLYGQHKNDSIISLKKDSIITQKSDSISTLSKKLKWQKLKTKGIIALWVIREAVGVGAKVAR